MNLTSPSQVKAWCIEHDFHPNKVLGQNFLVDLNAVKAIVDAGLEEWKSEKVEKWNGAGEEACVLEIGPGLGVLTEELLKRGCRVTAVEKDPALAARLAESLGRPPNLTVVADDAIGWIAGMGRASEKGDVRDESGVSDGGPSSPLFHSSTFPLFHSSTLTHFHSSTFPLFSHMISNLPYQAGTRILLELVQRRCVPAMTALVQTEVAERLAAGPGSKTRGLAGVWAQLDYDVRIVRKVSASCFWPRPAVGSSVVRLDLHGRNAGLSEDVRRTFRSVTKRAFEHRRKQLGSVFRGEVASSARAEDLSNDDWIEMAKSFASGQLPFVL